MDGDHRNAGGSYGNETVIYIKNRDNGHEIAVSPKTWEGMQKSNFWRNRYMRVVVEEPPEAREAKRKRAEKLAKQKSNQAAG